MHTDAADSASSTEALKFFHWAYANGGAMAAELDYVPIPPKVTQLVETTWAKTIKGQGKSLWPAQ